MSQDLDFGSRTAARLARFVSTLVAANRNLFGRRTASLSPFARGLSVFTGLLRTEYIANCYLWAAPRHAGRGHQSRRKEFLRTSIALLELSGYALFFAKCSCPYWGYLVRPILAGLKSVLRVLLARSSSPTSRCALPPRALLPAR